jgi:uncharacterized protein (TIGR02001 family)
MTRRTVFPLCALALAAAAFDVSAQTTTAPAAAAETAPTPPAPGTTFGDFTLTGNAGLFSDYRFRGFTQTGYKPAFQGGFDLSHASGFYIGNWNSNVEQGLYRGASLEMDFYGGYKYTFLEDFTVDVGGYYYYYPTKHSSGGGYAGYGRQAKEGEVYVGLAWKTVSVKYWYALTNYFGLGDRFQGGPHIDTNGSGYVEANGTYDLGDGWGLAAHVGLQYIKNNTQFVDVDGNTLSHSVVDYKVGATKDLSGWVVAAGVVGTSKKKYFGTATSLEAGGKVRPLVSVSKTF